MSRFGENTLAAGYVHGSIYIMLILAQAAFSKLYGSTILDTYSGAHFR